MLYEQQDINEIVGTKIEETIRHCEELVQKKVNDARKNIMTIMNERHSNQQKRINGLNHCVLALVGIILIPIAFSFTFIVRYFNMEQTNLQIHFNDVVKFKHISESCTLNYPANIDGNVNAICHYYRNDYDYWKMVSTDGESITGPIAFGSTIKLVHQISKKHLLNNNGAQATVSNERDESSNWRIISPDLRSGYVTTGVALVFVNTRTNRKLYSEGYIYGSNLHNQPHEVICTTKSDLNALWKIIEIKDRYYQE